MGTSLDDNIKSRSNRARWDRRQDQRYGWGQRDTFGRGREAGTLRRGPLRVNPWLAPYANAKPFRRPKDLMWRHDLFEDGMAAAGLTGIESGTKLYVSNLDYGVSNEDIKELFSEIGELKRYAVHYDRNGRSIGSAEVVFTRRSDAIAAVKRYNNVQLDGKPMKVELIGTNAGAPVSARVNVTGVNGRRRRTVVMTPESGQGMGPASVSHGPSKRNRRGSRRGNRVRGRGRGHGRKKPVEKSADELDKELENYHAGAMST
ncbi:hypothetical protein AAC387_Pa09g2397 [Persea americana]|eukprot:TRINITY_DN418_c1_g2_i1.p1 TRINITY_DN418_c1_g2~~TRINITY_DN418_c1_g2_i1.p1  ORF type:complete len:260 (+),score=55.46 TRINITY_DN418_c1_g2_i1:264-1043(+)